MFRSETDAMRQIRQRRQGLPSAASRPPDPQPNAAGSHHEPDYESVERSAQESLQTTYPLPAQYRRYGWPLLCGLIGGIIVLSLVVGYGMAAWDRNRATTEADLARKREQQQAAERVVLERAAAARAAAEAQRLAQELAARAKFDAVLDEGRNLVKVGEFGHARAVFLNNQRSTNRPEWRQTLQLHASGCENALLYDGQFVPHIEAARSALHQGRQDEARGHLDAAAQLRPDDPWLFELRDELHGR